MEEVEVPQYFVCPISLQIMKDPVTAITGMTYDRESIEKWLKTTTKTDPSCPITKQPLPRDSYLTPNHTLLRLIQAWCTSGGFDRIPTPKPLLDKTHVLKLVKDLDSACFYMDRLMEIELLVKENERNRKCMEDAGVCRVMILLLIRFFKQKTSRGVEEALRIFHLTWSPSDETKALLNHEVDFISALTWVLHCDEVENHVKTQALLAMKMVTEISSGWISENLNLEFFKQIISVLRKEISQQATKSALHILTEAYPWGRNRKKIIEANGIFELIELELSKPEKKITEQVFNLLANLCSCADGRAKFLSHAGGLAMVSKRILRVSPATDDRGIHILSLISKFSATKQVLLEMLRVGGVTKLCMVIQADCDAYLKKKAREVLRLHSKVWSNSPCIAVYLLTRYQR